jgi:hypothetical protein
MLRYYPAPFFEFNRGNHEKVVSRHIFVFRIDVTSIKNRSKHHASVNVQQQGDERELKRSSELGIKYEITLIRQYVFYELFYIFLLN